jgi:hypothetical protein
MLRKATTQNTDLMGRYPSHGSVPSSFIIHRSGSQSCGQAGMRLKTYIAVDTKKIQIELYPHGHIYHLLAAEEVPLQSMWMLRAS